MNYRPIKKLLQQFKDDTITMDDFIRELEHLNVEDLEHTTLDHQRKARLGFPEVIFCQNKTPQQVADIAGAIAKQNYSFLATRASLAHFKAVKRYIKKAQYNTLGKTISFSAQTMHHKPHRLLIITAGTSDIPVAEEAKETALVMGLTVETIYDIGVAGIHRVFHNWDKIHEATIIIVIAGMEGALPSVIGGLAPCPVIAVPTSVGYGASFQGIAALLGMLNSCAPGISVVNIDNGFGAVYCAYRIIKNLPDTQ
ncbi:MAG TPA: nickel pincer cofactor biosynthesis protein LarB [Spirochaetota bacterium]|nr:nickel pincer cofactor biosynthesis protein LarB [Spirochaetota bacterium]HOM86774.1 nickel pincer cofactor biosynthesis protein LarB [Spirochaetota bacterium]HOT18556.1 nickel pincer cofactor biosynthesis protein LarB [Spirochaetota bacterium]HPD03641.1 nickel pincer cofactor biosynthesis protein LarB [Spirochaetota bacterium]HQG43002.1 nickel pincer cofactor biosynthesis protein LarB [Spirochaetota bacterium]